MVPFYSKVVQRNYVPGPGTYTPSAFPCVIHDTFYDSNTSVSLKVHDCTYAPVLFNPLGVRSYRESRAVL